MPLACVLWAVVVSTCLGSSMAQKVTQTQPEMSVYEAETVTLDCTFDTRVSNYYLFWYKQPPSGEMVLIIRQEANKQENATNNRFSVNFQKADKSFSLRISAAQLGDAAMYLCALQGQGFSFIFGKGTRLLVKPTIQNPDPAVYQLKSPESSNISVCLFTDFDSEVNVNPSTESNMIRLKSTSLDMKTMDSKSNGALAWSNSFDLGCNSTFNYTFHSSSEFPCDANVVEKGFETDMNLNFDNLTVIMFRIIFLKAVGFNLLMTLKLWSS